MAKKSSTQPESEPLSAAAKKPAKPRASKAAKSASTAVGTKKTVPKSAAKPLVIKKKKKQVTIEEIQLRAYFIAEARQQQGAPGDPDSDWVEAERQLLAELLIKPIL